MYNIYCIIGRSGVGKTTIANILENKYNLKSVESYTTRPPRCENEPGHIFVTKEEFDKIPMVAYTLFNGYEYGVSEEVLNQSDIYVIDIDGLEYLKEKYHNKPLKTINLRVDEDILKERMKLRGDSDDAINSRINNDDIKFIKEKNYPFDLVIDCNAKLDYIAYQIMQHIAANELIAKLNEQLQISDEATRKILYAKEREIANLKGQVAVLTYELEKKS